VKHYGILALNLDVHVTKGTYFIIQFHFKSYPFYQSLWQSVNWRPQSLWLLPIRRMQG